MKFLFYMLAFTAGVYVTALAIIYALARVREQQEGFDVEVRQGLKALERLANGR